ncbi:hypothetical protein AGABI2DRAFT_178851, partial [Agaricus bisporus var. bisporus H97]|uniref:hypothetical protein n=1 Tax=Agaricus bisporus var. bisporus (strain H97 / ATCC MYA-4626 / FGSC 10389) TaxID=936046 RepID=UPI00029F7C01
MAIQFQQADVIGIDIVMPSMPGALPSNYRFEQLDLAEGIPDEYTGRSDIMHCRCTVQHMKDPPKLVNELIRCLKPALPRHYRTNELGGLVIIPEVIVGVLDEERKPVTSFFYNSEIDDEENIVNARKLSGIGGYLAFLDQLIRSPDYRAANVLLESTGAVRDIRFEEFLSPVGWAGKDIRHGEEIGALLCTMLKTIFGTLYKKLISH